MEKCVFLDCESDGLRGEIFSAALVGFDGETLFCGWYEHPALEKNPWIIEHVSPHLMPKDEMGPSEFRAEFAAAWHGATEAYGWEPWGIGRGKALACVAHMGSPVESNFFQELWDYGLIGDFDGPYPLLDTAPLIAAAGYPPDSEIGYAEAMGLPLPKRYKSHDALSDARLTRRVWGSFFLFKNTTTP
jgi:hypothetical protein